MSISTMIKLIRTGSPDPIFWYTLALSVGAISVALYTQFILGYAPCTLCLYERLPYLALGKISFSGLFATRFDKFWKICACVTFVVSICISGYHTCVERGWLNASSTCNPELKIPENLSDAEAIDLLSSQPIATCTVAPFKVMYLSMTEWNLVVNFALLLLMSMRIKLNNARPVIQK